MKKPAAKKPAAKKPAAKKPALPAALAKRAEAQHALRVKRLAERGRVAIARIRERQADVAENMVDIGLALAELKADGVAEALGRVGFAEVCAEDLRMPLSTANALVAIATRVPRELVASLGADRARAVLELVDATPADDTPADVVQGTLTLPSGRAFDVGAATTKEIREAARAFRDARPEAATKRSRGFTATPAERATFTRLTKHVKAHGTAKLVATRGGGGARVRFEVPLADVAAFAAALRKGAKG